MTAVDPIHPDADVTWAVFTEWRATRSSSPEETVQRRADWHSARRLARNLACLFVAPAT